MNLTELKAATNEALAAAREHKSKFSGDAINWGDLRCVSAEKVEDDDGFVTYRVVIEEASPSCQAINRFVRDRLSHRFDSVEVVTEW